MHRYVFSARLYIWIALAFAAACNGLPAESISAEQAPLQGPNGISADLVIDTQWAQGYCARVIVSNHHATATTNRWSVGLDLRTSTTYTTWTGVFSGSTGSVTVTPTTYNAAIPPGGNTQLGL